MLLLVIIIILPLCKIVLSLSACTVQVIAISTARLSLILLFVWESGKVLGLSETRGGGGETSLTGDETSEASGGLLVGLGDLGLALCGGDTLGLRLRWDGLGLLGGGGCPLLAWCGLLRSFKFLGLMERFFFWFLGFRVDILIEIHAPIH